MLGTTRAVGIEIYDDYCSDCSICSTVCPFEAISIDEKSGEVKLDIAKCQMCGICVSACPSSAIDLVYYNITSLTNYVKKQMDETGLKTLVLTCRGSNPVIDDIGKMLKEEKVENFISLRLPCVGRVPPQFFLKTLALDMERIIVVQCEEDYCRFKRGSRIGANRLSLLRALIAQLGYKTNTLTMMRNAMKAVYDTEKCVGCGKCVFICPYDAIEWNPIGTPQINSDACVGCGACALVCPHQAIELKGYEYEPVFQLIRHYSVKARKLRSRGVRPIVLVFCCQWSEFSALDQPENKLFDNKAIVMEIPCFKGLDPVHVVGALCSGFDGVMAVVCSPEDCKLELGRDVAERNVSVLQRALDKLNLRDRFEIDMASPRFVGDFNKKLDAFIQKIGALPLLDLAILPQVVKTGRSGE